MPYLDPADQARCARAHYEANKDAYVKRALEHKAKQKDLLREALLDYLLKNPCVDCGEKDVVVLDFDHRDPGEKSFAVSDAIRRGYSMRRVLAEVRKCDVRCANCHRRRTARQFGWWSEIAAR